jgi:hypothetical protein
MNIKKLILYALIVVILLVGQAASVGQSSPILTPSTFCVHSNDQIFIEGHGLIPGERILGFLLSSHYRSPLWVLYPDTNGDLHEEITFRGNLNPWGPTAVQVYQFSGQSTNITFHVWYQTCDQKTNQWQSVITNLVVMPLHPNSPSDGSQINIDATVMPYNNYQVQAATNVLGPWLFIGSPSKSEDSYSWYSIGLQLPPSPQKFFRLANPYAPCPCDF